MQRAPEGGFVAEVAARPFDGDGTAAHLEAIESPGAASGARFHLPAYWPDGGLVNLAAVAAALLVHAVHSAGLLPIDAAALDSDVLVFPTCKRVMGPCAGGPITTSRSCSLTGARRVSRR